MSSAWWVYAIGFLAQGFFSARLLVQWIASERAKRVLSPDVFWVFSLCGSILLFAYGWLRHDFSIILGQLISYYVYIWNLNVKGLWHKLGIVLRVAIFVLPVVAVALMLDDAAVFVHKFFFGKVPLWLVAFGSTGQVIFALRFVYQWYYSYHRRASLLPAGFWGISLVGSAIIVCYGVFRLDPVLILGQSFGLVVYIRNLIIGKKQKIN